MKIKYNNLYTHFVFTTINRLPLILDQHRVRIEKYITGIVNNNGCKLYSIYANPEHVHFLVKRNNEVMRLKMSRLRSISATEVVLFWDEVKMRFGGVLVNQILSAKKENSAADISELERKIDGIVYGLYELSEEEIDIIEKI